MTWILNIDVLEPMWPHLLELRPAGLCLSIPILPILRQICKLPKPSPEEMGVGWGGNDV